MPAQITLENGLVLSGRAIGAPVPAGGEVVFHTGMTGYQEILTDPSYAGQIVVFTAPHIGNYGIHAGDFESARVRPAAIVVRDFCRRSFHRRSENDLDSLLRRAGIPALTDVDTRALTVAIRDGGTCRAMIGDGEADEMVEQARALPTMQDEDWVAKVSTTEAYEFSEQPDAEDPFEVAVLDCGVKKSILRRLVMEGCRVRVFPHDTPAMTLLRGPTEGVFLSNGPGDPATRPDLVEKIQKLVRAEVPIFGICLGHQLLARALGAETIKLPFGHHGANHPVQNLATGRVEITSQNHNYAVPDGSLDPAVASVTHLSLNDRSIEGLETVDGAAYSVQYHPEAAPGPSDSLYLFRRFRETMLARRERSSHAAQG